MSVRTRNEYYFPSKVYRCACLGEIIQNCFNEGIYAMIDIADEISKITFDNDDEQNKVFVVKVGNQSKDCIFTCAKHLSIMIFAKRDFTCTETPSEKNVTVTYSCGKRETYCIGCIRHYLKLMYEYFYYVNFDLKFS